jgi:hypothetical protein
MILEFSGLGNHMRMIGSKLSVWKAEAIVVATSMLMFAIFFYDGKLEDCKPYEGDGQCGLGTFVSIIFGAIVAATLFIVGTIYVGIMQLRKREERELLENDRRRSLDDRF